MVRRPQVLGDDSREPDDGDPGAPDLDDLEALYEPGPGFRTTLRGYDRRQVDAYVAWVEEELRAARRECDDLLSRYTACAAELHVAQRLLACSPEGRELLRTSEQVGELLRVAADEAAELTEAGAAEADRLRAEARAEADALLRRAHEVKEEAVAESDRLVEEAHAARAAARAELEQARVQAGQLLREATEAASDERVAARTELEELQSRQYRTREALDQLTGQIDAALRALADDLTGEPDDGAGREPMAS